MNRDTTRVLGSVIPLFCLLLAATLVFLQFRRLNTIRDELRTETSKEEALRDKIAKFAAAKPYEKVAAVSWTPNEETVFLDEIKNSAISSGIDILKWSSTARPAGVQGSSNAQKKAKQPPALRGITAISSQLEVHGPYEGVRDFVVRVQKSPRMLNLSNVTWRRGTTGGTRLQMTVHRYVFDPGVGEAAVAGTAAVKGEGTQ